MAVQQMHTKFTQKCTTNPTKIHKNVKKCTHNLILKILDKNYSRDHVFQRKD